MSSGAKLWGGFRRGMHLAATKQRLDKNRNLLPPLRYEIVKPEKLDLAKELLYNTYHPEELLTKHLGLCAGINSIPDMDRLLEKTVNQNLSMFALDMQGNAMGVCINGLYTRDDWTRDVDIMAEKFNDPKARPLAAIRQVAFQRGLRIFDDMGTDTIFGIKMVASHPALTGLGMSTDIIRRSILLAGCLGYDGIQAEASALFAQKALLTIGFIPVVEISYKDFTYNSEKIFEGIEEPEAGFVLFQKKFFQTCLKHIV